jgi:hypothetical protein
MKRKIMTTPWRVKMALYVWAETRCMPDRMSTRRNMSPSRTPTKKKASVETRYRMPMRLWSVVKSQPRTPGYLVFA